MTSSAANDDAGGDIFVTPRNEGFPYEAVYLQLSDPLLDENSNASGEGTPFTRSIRLLRLFPGCGDDPISCELIPRIRLSSTGENSHIRYEAVSYAAGDAADSVSIVLNGHPFNVFRNLFAALKQFRRTTDERVLWIDQICINQTDIAERDSQVLLMRQIYKQAHCTLAWLGEADDRTDLAFDFLDDFLSKHGDHLRRQILQSDDPTDASSSNEKGRARPMNETRESLRRHTQWYQKIGMKLRRRHESRSTADEHILEPALEACASLNNILPNNYQSWKSLQSVLTRPWWSRCWILREVVVSNDVTVYCGSRSGCWNDLGLLIVIIYFNLHALNEAARLPDAQSMLNCILLVLTRTTSPSPGIIRLLYAHRICLASDPRDKVYSILGLLNQDILSSYKIRLSYLPSNRVEDVFIAAAKAGIQVDQDWPFRALSGAESERGLPSWAPDWQVETQPGAMFTVFFESHNAGGPFPQGDYPLFLDSDRALRLSGFLIGVVDVLGKAGEAGGDLKTVDSWLTIAFEKAQGRGQSSSQFLEQFTRIMYVDTERFLDAPCSREGHSEDTITSYWTEKFMESIHSTQAFARRFVLSKFFTLRENQSDLEHSGMGLVSSAIAGGAEAGDEVYVVIGCPEPLVLRRNEAGIAYEGMDPNIAQYRVVGECYVQGVMKGELMEQLALMREQSNGEDPSLLRWIDLI